MNKIGTHYRYRMSPSGRPDKEVEPKIIKEDFPFTEVYVNNMNAQTQEHGNFIVVDEDKTRDYYEKGKVRQEQRNEEEEVKKALALAKLSDAADKVVENTAKKVTRRKRKPKNEE